jgi:hypothetical protein
MAEDRWQELIVAGVLRVTSPAGSSPSWVEDGRLLQICLHDSAFHIACHQVPTSADGASKVFLEEQVRRFCDDCIPKGANPSSGIVTTRDPERETITSQAFAMEVESRWWVVRAVALEASSQWFLISWNGKGGLLPVPVLEILESFVPLA